MAITGVYYIVLSSKAGLLNASKTREPLNSDDLSNLRRDKDNTMFVINSQEEIPGSTYVTKFASRAAMMEYITTETAWITVDMTATREEQANVAMNDLTAVARENLLRAWVPKNIMKAGTTDEPTVLSESFTSVGDNANCDTDSKAIRIWFDINERHKGHLVAGYVGGENSIFSATEIYNAHNMIYVPGDQRGITIDVPPATTGAWTLFLGFQPFNGGNMTIYLMGGPTSTTSFYMDDLAGIHYLFHNGEEAASLKEFPLGEHQVVGHRGSGVQAYPVFIQYNGDGKITVPVGVGSSWTIGEENQYIAEIPAHRPVYPASFKEVVDEEDVYPMFNEVNRVTHTNVACMAMWDKELTIDEMKAIKAYIATL
jgi:hypothetical protein